MEKEQEYEVFQDAISFFGEVSQKIMAVEEMSELTKELAKDLRDRGNVEQIADEIAEMLRSTSTLWSHHWRTLLHPIS